MRLLSITTMVLLLLNGSGCIGDVETIIIPRDGYRIRIVAITGLGATEDNSVAVLKDRKFSFSNELLYVADGYSDVKKWSILEGDTRDTLYIIFGMMDEEGVYSRWGFRSKRDTVLIPLE